VPNLGALEDRPVHPLEEARNSSRPAIVLIPVHRSGFCTPPPGTPAPAPLDLPGEPVDIARQAETARMRREWHGCCLHPGQGPVEGRSPPDAGLCPPRTRVVGIRIGGRTLTRSAKEERTT
jgi:hypothetical protein